MEVITSTSIVLDRRSGNLKSNKSFFHVHSFLNAASLQSLPNTYLRAKSFNTFVLLMSTFFLVLFSTYSYTKKNEIFSYKEKNFNFYKIICENNDIIYETGGY